MNGFQSAMYIWRKDGDFYTGEFFRGAMEGFGVMTSNKEKTRYAGYFRRGERQGLGLHQRMQDFQMGCYSKDSADNFGIYLSELKRD